MAEKQYPVGNNYEYGVCDECEFRDLDKDGDCRKSLEYTCPKVAKPITVDCFEIRPDKKVYPCYEVEWEGNSTIQDWYATEQAAIDALERSKGNE